MRIGFRLCPLPQVGFWSDPARPHLHWFGLSQGHFWLEVGEVQLLRFDDAFLAAWPDPTAQPDLPYVDYYVVRLWEDLLEMLPIILRPLPPPLAGRLDPAEAWQAWQHRAEAWMLSAEEGDEGGDLPPPDDGPSGDPAWDLHYAATGWWSQHRLTVHYLVHSPRIWFWREGETVRVRWDNRAITDEEGHAVWQATAGEHRLPLADFLAAIESFHRRFLRAMAWRIAQLRAGWFVPAAELDLDELDREQRERAGRLDVCMAWAASEGEGDWRRAEAALRAMDERLRPAAPN